MGGNRKQSPVLGLPRSALLCRWGRDHRGYGCCTALSAHPTWVGGSRSKLVDVRAEGLGEGSLCTGGFANGRCVSTTTTHSLLATPHSPCTESAVCSTYNNGYAKLPQTKSVDGVCPEPGMRNSEMSCVARGKPMATTTGTVSSRWQGGMRMGGWTTQYGVSNSY